MFKKWVLDVTSGIDRGLCFYPFDDEFIISEMAVYTSHPPGEVVGVVHADGQGAADKWCADNCEIINCIMTGEPIEA